MKQINVPVGDEIYNEAKIAAAQAGMLFKDWVAKAVHECAAPHITFTATFPKSEPVETDAPEWPSASERAESLAQLRTEKHSPISEDSDAPGELTIDPNQDFGA